MLAKIKSQKYAVVDLEATSAGSDAKIIQVGIVLIDDGQISKTYETDVNPYEPLSSHIKDLTGLSDERLAVAPDFAQVAREIYQLLEGRIFVAHNVKFDGNLLAEALFFEGFELRTPRVDTVELAQVFFPSLERYNLPYLAQVLGLELDDAHTAIADAKATAQLFLGLIERIASLPKLTLAKLLTWSDQLIYETGQVISDIFQELPERPLVGYQEVMGLVLQPGYSYRDSYQLSERFDHNLALLGLEERPQQATFADVIAQRLSDDRVSFIEAPSGMGKTYGYLLSLLAKAKGRRLVVATPTKVLQDQIMATEGQALADVFHINCHSLKGYQNYIKLDRFWESLQRQDDNRLVNRYKMKLLVWLTETATGDLDEIKQQQAYPTFFSELRHDGQLSEKSPFGEVDFWHRSYQKAQFSQLIVTNHSYLLTRIEDDKAFLEGAILVIDEVQKLPLNLEHFSRRSYSILDIMEQVEREHAAVDQLLDRRLLESLAFHLGTLPEKASKGNLSQEQVQAIRQDLSELGADRLPILRDLFAPQFDEFWLTKEKLVDKRRIYLHAASLAFLGFSHLLPEGTKVFGVSATLDISPRLSLAQLLGFEEEKVTVDYLPDPGQEGQKIWLPTDLAPISTMTDEGYARFIIEQILRLARLGQPSLILFNANQTLRLVSEGLSQLGISHLAQHIHGSAIAIKKRFERGDSQILLGSGAFWEGVDFAQPSEICLVLTRLPFDNPQDKFVQKVNARLRQEGKHPFHDYQLPMMILKLKQAIGRTKRHQTQKSAVLILDNRILTKPYAKQVQRVLKKSSQLLATDFDQALKGIADFLGD